MSRSSFCGATPEPLQLAESVGVPSENSPLFHLPNPLTMSFSEENRLTQGTSTWFYDKECNKHSLSKPQIYPPTKLIQQAEEREGPQRHTLIKFYEWNFLLPFMRVQNSQRKVVLRMKII